MASEAVDFIVRLDALEAGGVQPRVERVGERLEHRTASVSALPSGVQIAGTSNEGVGAWISPPPTRRMASNM